MRGWHGETERLSGFQVHYQLNFGCLLDRKIAWLSATECLIDVLRSARDVSATVLAVTEEKTKLCQPRSFADSWNLMVQRQLNDMG